MTKFIDNVYELATETECDQILRRLANSAANNLNVNLRESLDLQDEAGNGLLEKQDLKRALKNCQIPVSENELDIIYKEMGAKIAGRGGDDGEDAVAQRFGSFNKSRQMPTKSVIEIRKFINRIELIGKSKPLPQYIFNQKGGKGANTK